MPRRLVGHGVERSHVFTGVHLELFPIRQEVSDTNLHAARGGRAPSNAVATSRKRLATSSTEFATELFVQHGPSLPHRAA